MPVVTGYRWFALLALVCLTAGAAAFGRGDAPGGGSAVERQRAERELEGIRREIERLRNEMNREASERDRATRSLREAEVSVGEARAEIDRLRRERSERSRRRADLAVQKGKRELELAAERQALAGQMRAAQRMGREEPLKLLLNQRDPARAGRMFAYYGYLGRARAEQIVAIREHMARIEELDSALAEEDSRLADLERRQRGELDRLEAARRQRGEVLRTLQAESRSRIAALDRLRQQQAGLERLLRELRRATERFPLDTNSPFGRLQGQLAWPVAGELLQRFGTPRAGRLRWEGLLIGADRGAPVRAIAQGRVVYSDWLAGLGQLVIVDHGDGWLSLYGHNESLFRKVGDSVKAGESLASVGDSGGRARPELYFEIRRNGRPVDPRPWFRNPTPPR